VIWYYPSDVFYLARHLISMLITFNFPIAAITIGLIDNHDHFLIDLSICPS